MLSVIIPTYDRPTELYGCLQALARLDARDQIEVIVVDDGGRMPARTVAEQFADRLSLQTIVQPHAGPAEARNAGARVARGEWLAFLDDDCQVHRDWFIRAHERLGGSSDMIGGATQNDLDDNPYSACHQLLLDYLYQHFNSSRENARFCASNNLCVPADRFRELGGFDSGFPFAAGEDRDLCERWREHGWRLVYAPEIMVHHTHRMTLRSFARQHFRYGRGARRYHERRAERGQNASADEAPGFYAALLLYPMRRPATSRRVFLTALMFLAQVATTCGYVAEMTVTDSRHS